MHTNPEAWHGQNVIGRLPKREAEKIRKDEQRTVLDPKKQPSINPGKWI